jgi:hypothetical protein
MNNVFAWLGGRKFVVALLALIAVPLSLHSGITLTPDMQEKILTTIATIAGAFSVGQGIADGLSGGKTSSVVQATTTTTNAG